jgi:antitoxin component of MazEF toxin-antitoxin module
MVKTLTPDGNSLVLTIDGPTLEATGIDADTPLEISTAGDVIVISPVRSRKGTAKLEKILGKLDREYAGVFGRLAVASRPERS